MGIRLYEKLPIRMLVNPEAIPLLMIAGHDGARLSKKRALRVRHDTGSGDIADEAMAFLRVFKGCKIKEHQFQGLVFRKITMHMEGTEYDKKIFALMADKHITLSPVPFGDNGKPELPDLPGLLECIAFVFDNPKTWEQQNLIAKLKNLTAHLDTNIGHVLSVLTTIPILRFRGGGYDIVMTPERFTEIFGVELPAPKIFFSDGKTCQIPLESVVPGNYVPVGTELDKRSWREVCYLSGDIANLLCRGTNTRLLAVANAILITSVHHGHLIGVYTKSVPHGWRYSLVEWRGQMNMVKLAEGAMKPCPSL